ncbi:adenosylcobinamide kinase/adenosylcobinamide phosphate guanyltransferase [Actinopolyspora erythraea]|uniref:Adenosylcobinamide kinase n=1 Tax=Actinopolyspora erythraea TaxID=414996 RepID=A0A099D554_9ACTN|nr:bifunctional adenosylcobinamide kinase/adenosylcobinamide-phosphate guanylyltransferase [Actinopolyspora erythraea]ASU79575.1 adenosylcobinamide kinase/adenosylcobinamide phosphate guanyltransferase [Actinopolyspora erythraea]KGI81036.1 adenosylcobinamide kinase [Actinopolyspora erythraea]
MSVPAHRTLVLGGARSGKSAHAEGLLPPDGAATYAATARRDPDDPEWNRRIAEHVARRPDDWRTVETPEPGSLVELLDNALGTDPPVLVDDLATWLTGALDDAGAWEGADSALGTVARQRGELVRACGSCRARLVLVSAEVGLGVVPDNRAARLFRDELGTLNASLAEVCDEVLLLVAGLPLRLR